MSWVPLRVLWELGFSVSGFRAGITGVIRRITMVISHTRGTYDPT